MKRFWCASALCLFSINSLAAIALLLTGLSLFLIHEAHMNEAPWMDRIRDGSICPPVWCWTTIPTPTTWSQRRAACSAGISSLFAPVLFLLFYLP